MNLTLPISWLRTDGGTQARGAIDSTVVADYAEAMKRGDVFPPISVCVNGKHRWVIDGFHRVRAAEQAGRDKIVCNVVRGSLADAQWRSYANNKTHGLRRTRDDVQRAVRAALAHPKAAGLSNRQIAEHIGCDEGTIRAWRDKLQATAEIPQSTIRTGRDGRTIDVGKIGKTGKQHPLIRRDAAAMRAEQAAAAPPVENPVGRTFELLEQTPISAEEPYSIEAALAHIILDIMTSPLDLRAELVRRLQECLALGRLDKPTGPQG